MALSLAHRDLSVAGRGLAGMQRYLGVAQWHLAGTQWHLPIAGLDVSGVSKGLAGGTKRSGDRTNRDNFGTNGAGLKRRPQSARSHLPTTIQEARLRVNQVCQPSVSSSQIHLAIAFTMSPTSVGFRVKPGMR